MQGITQNKSLEQNCKKILEHPEIRFCGIINNLGNLIAGGFKKGILPLESDSKRQISYMQMVLDINMRKEHDDSLGEIEYSATKRGKVMMISIPRKEDLVLISAEPNADPHQITKLVNYMLGSTNYLIHV